MKPRLLNNISPSRQNGFTLTEIMIGLVIGLLVSMVIVQVMSTFENDKNITSGTANAQINGSISLYSISRELQLAGYPFLPNENSALECNTLTTDGVADPSPNPMGLTPIFITDGGAASDTLLIRFGDSNTGGALSPITQFPSAITGGANANDITLDTNLGCQTGDRVLMISGKNCALTSASSVPAAGALTSGVASAVSNTMTLSNISLAGGGVQLACLGTWNEITYRVNASKLERRNLVEGPNFVPVISDIVALQAQYGISAASNTNPIVQWVDATGAWQNPTIINRNRIKAVRLAVVARNPKREPEEVTKICNAVTNEGLCSWRGIPGSPAPAITIPDDTDGTSWKNYRYRVFDAIIPLRNVVWAKGTLG